MDLDIAQVRAFLAISDEQHFGRAAEHLMITQQALSKRMARLETVLGVQLLNRQGHTVQLSEAGSRLLEPARQAVAAADRAVAIATQVYTPLRMDMWGHLYDPGRTIRAVRKVLPADVPLEAGMSRDFATTIAALARAETDVGFGRIHTGKDGTQAVYTHRLVRLEPIDAILSEAHPLADCGELRPVQLRGSILWCPTAVERLDFLGRFAERFGIPTASGPTNLGLQQLLHDLHSDPLRFSLLPADLEVPELRGFRTIRLVRPTPLYAWSLLWRPHLPHPMFETLLHAFADVAGQNRWLEYRPERDWLPDTDLARALQAPPGQ